MLRFGSLDESTRLARRAQAGDERAFGAIFKAHYAPLLSCCCHLLGNRDDGEDALQQTFVKADRALRTGPAPRELRPWLYAIARPQTEEKSSTGRKKKARSKTVAKAPGSEGTGTGAQLVEGVQLPNL